MLEDFVPDASEVISCFIPDSYYFKKIGMRTWPLRDFIKLLRAVNDEKKKVIFANLHGRIDAMPRYVEDSDIPF